MRKHVEHALDAQGGQKCGPAGVVHPPGDQVPHGLRDPSGGQVTAGQEQREQLGEPLRRG